MEEKELGFDSDSLIILELHTDAEQAQHAALKGEIQSITGVIGVGGVSNLPGSQFNQNGLYIEGHRDNRVVCSELRVDFDALALMGIALKEGRLFQPSRKLDSLGNSYLINESAWSQFQADNIFEEAILWDEEVGLSRGNVVGILEDFHYKSLHEPIRPLAIKINEDAINYLMVKVQAGTYIPAILKSLQEVHSQFDSQYSFEYSFLDQSLEAVYQADRQAVFDLQPLHLYCVTAFNYGLGRTCVSADQSKNTRDRNPKSYGCPNHRHFVARKSVLSGRFDDFLNCGPSCSLFPDAFLVGKFCLPDYYRHLSVWNNGASSSFIGVLCVFISVLRTTLRNPGEALRYE